jgi:cellulose synthase/poly-beta-1,6-N-acetylglucosamine synthase-like glycosyltransferase
MMFPYPARVRCPSLDRQLKVTVGIVSFDEQQSIGRALDLILSQRRDLDFEVIVVAGGSDSTVDIVKRYHSSFPDFVFIEEKVRRGKPSAINQILERGKGDVIALTDGDVYLGQSSIARLVESFDDPNVGAATGRIVAVNARSNFFGFWANFLFDTANARRARDASSGVLYHLSGYLSAIRTGIVQSIPEDSLADDATLGIMVRVAGYRVAYVPESTVFVKFPENLSDFFLQKRRTMAGAYQLRQRFGVRDRSILQEAREGLFQGFRYCKRPSEYFYFMSLAFARIIAWALAFWDMRVKKRDIMDLWRRVSSTKQLSRSPAA